MPCQHFNVHQFMHKGWGLLLGGRLSGKQRDLASVAHAKSGSNALFELKRDALSNNKIHKAVAVLSGAAGDTLEAWKLRPFGLARTGAIGGPESNQDGLILSANVLLGFLALLPTNPDHGSENADAPLTLLDIAAKLVPRKEAATRVASLVLPPRAELAFALNRAVACTYMPNASAEGGGASARGGGSPTLGTKRSESGKGGAKRRAAQGKRGSLGKPLAGARAEAPERTSHLLFRTSGSALRAGTRLLRNSSDGFRSTAGITNSVVCLYRRGSRYRSHTEGKTERTADGVNLTAPSNVNVKRSQGQIRRVAALPDCSLRSPASAPEVVRISG